MSRVGWGLLVFVVGLSCPSPPCEAGVPAPVPRTGRDDLLGRIWNADRLRGDGAGWRIPDGDLSVAAAIHGQRRWDGDG